MDKPAKDRILALEAELEDAMVTIDIIQEENTELKERTRALEGQLARLMVDRAYEVG